MASVLRLPLRSLCSCALTIQYVRNPISFRLLKVYNQVRNCSASIEAQNSCKNLVSHTRFDQHNTTKLLSDSLNCDDASGTKFFEFVEDKTLLEKPQPFQPFEEFSSDSNLDPVESSDNAANVAEFIDSLAPPMPVSFNLAAYVNRSETLKKLVDLGVDLSYIEQKPARAKYINRLDFEKNMKHHIQFLHDNGITAENLGHFITKNPMIFKESLEDLQIRINYLLSKKFTSSAISRIIFSNPYFLTTLTREVDFRLGFLQKNFILSGDDVRCLLTKCPKIVSYDFFKLKEKLFVFKDVMGFSHEQMKTLLLRKPKVYMLGRKVLEERFNIVHNMMGISQERILQYPGILLRRGFSLRQRHQYLVHIGRAQYDTEKPCYVSLHALATTTDYSFCKTCTKTSTDAYNEFLKTL